MKDMHEVNGITLETLKCDPVARAKFECYAYAARRVLEDTKLISNKKMGRTITEDEGAFVTAIGKKIQALFPREVDFLRSHDDAHAILLLNMPRGELASILFHSGLLSFGYPKMHKTQGKGKEYFPAYFDKTQINNREYKKDYYGLEIFSPAIVYMPYVPTFHHDKGNDRQLLHTIKPGDGLVFRLRANQNATTFRELVLPPDSTLYFRGHVAGRQDELPMEHCGEKISYKRGSSPAQRAGENNRSPFEDDQPPEGKVKDRHSYGIFLCNNILKKPDRAVVAKWEKRIEEKYAELEAAGKFDGLIPGEKAAAAMRSRDQTTQRVRGD